VEKPGGKRPLGIPRRWWVDNIEMDLREIRWDCMDWTDLAQDGSSGYCCEHNSEFSGTIKLWAVLE
jgi:hypothetical protein